MVDHVRAHGLMADVQELGDFHVVHAMGKCPQGLALPCEEAGEGGARRLCSVRYRAARCSARMSSAGSSGG
jgi:hypothetical protein